MRGTVCNGVILQHGWAIIIILLVKEFVHSIWSAIFSLNTLAEQFFVWWGKKGQEGGTDFVI